MDIRVITGLMLHGLGAAVWLAVLAKVDVSMAYPFGFIITMILAIFALGEQASGVRIVGTVLIATGAILVTKS